MVLALLITFYGSLSLPLVPFLVSELQDAQLLYSLYTSGETESLDGLELLLLGSPLLRVWENVRAAVYCLEGSVTLTKAMATGAQIMTAASRLRYVYVCEVYTCVWCGLGRRHVQLV